LPSSSGGGKKEKIQKKNLSAHQPIKIIFNLAFPPSGLKIPPSPAAQVLGPRGPQVKIKKNTQAGGGGGGAAESKRSEGFCAAVCSGAGVTNKTAKPNTKEVKYSYKYIYIYTFCILYRWICDPPNCGAAPPPRVSTGGGPSEFRRGGPRGPFITLYIYIYIMPPQIPLSPGGRPGPSGGKKIMKGEK